MRNDSFALRHCKSIDTFTCLPLEGVTTNWKGERPLRQGKKVAESSVSSLSAMISSAKDITWPGASTTAASALYLRGGGDSADFGGEFVSVVAAAEVVEVVVVVEAEDDDDEDADSEVESRISAATRIEKSPTTPRDFSSRKSSERGCECVF